MKTKTEQWFEKLKDIWLRKAVDEVSGLMASEFKYYEDPHADPITDTGLLLTVWEEVKGQDIELLEIEPLVCTDMAGTVQYRFVATVSGERHESKGCYFVRLNDTGQATEFRQWWNEKC